jgi:hypothetical protein
MATRRSGTSPAFEALLVALNTDLVCEVLSFLTCSDMVELVNSMTLSVNDEVSLCNQTDADGDCIYNCSRSHDGLRGRMHAARVAAGRRRFRFSCTTFSSIQSASAAHASASAKV